MFLAQFGKPVRLIIVFIIASKLVIIEGAEDKNAYSKAEKENIVTFAFTINSPTNNINKKINSFNKTAIFTIKNET